MRWRSFALWNALGGISWAITIGLLAYFVGSSVKSAVTSFGLYGLAAVAVAVVGVLAFRRLHHRLTPSAPGPGRTVADPAPAPTPAATAPASATPPPRANAPAPTPTPDDRGTPDDEEAAAPRTSER